MTGKEQKYIFKAETKKKLHLFLYVGQRPFTYTASHTLSFWFPAFLPVQLINCIMPFA
jgi:hypothetical protein